MDDGDRLLRRCYEALTFVKAYTHPGLWDEKMVALYRDIEAHLNEPETGTIRNPRQDIIDRRRRRLKLIPPAS